jgi:hypothetical protein
MRKPVYGTTCRLTTAASHGGIAASPEALAAFLARPAQLDLYLFWHAITYLLTGAADGGKEPLCYLVHGGESLGRNDAGPVRYLTPEQVARFSDAIAGVSPDDFGEELYDLEAMDAEGIYPERWREDGDENDMLGDIRELYSYLQGYLRDAASRGVGTVVSYETTELSFEVE